MNRKRLTLLVSSIYAVALLVITDSASSSIPAGASEKEPQHCWIATLLNIA